jgi:hypothetical protein
VLEQFRARTDFFTHLRKQVARHATQCGLAVFLVRRAGRESFLLAERFLRFVHGKI